ncbi:MAG: site-specific integrase [Actinomycetota bacterium]|nr:site-specific integrase [Actinomycetota bacterium]
MASIQRRADGKWRARYRDEAGSEHARHFDRKVDAQAWLDQVTAALVTGTYADPRRGRITFEQFYASWSERQIWAPGTRLAMDLAAGSVPFAGVPMLRIRRSHVEAWVKSMDNRGLAAGTVHTRFGNVRSAFRAAVADRVIGEDPCSGILLPKRRRQEVAMQVPTAEQVGALLARAGGQFTAYLGFCAFAGLRLGEASGLQIGDVDFLRRTLRVRRQVQRTTGHGFEVRAPKYGSERDVFLAPGLVELVASHVETHRPGCGPEDWLFVNQGGDPPHQNTVGHWWRQARSRASVEGFTLHDLRHYYASGLIAAGCDVVTVQHALGHASATTTLSTYAHLWPNAEDRTRAAAEGMLSAALADSLRTEEAN